VVCSRCNKGLHQAVAAIIFIFAYIFDHKNALGRLDFKPQSPHKELRCSLDFGFGLILFECSGAKVVQIALFK